MGRPIEPELRDAYLRRLGLEQEPPSVDALQRLHRRHVEVVPYETMWIHAGEEWDLDPTQSAVRIATQGRGGYCYHVNGAFAELLHALGYDVHRHVGGVDDGTVPDPAAAGNHLVVTVRGLPSDENPAGTWYVDVGLGDALQDALPLVAGTYRQEPFDLVLSASDDHEVGWHLTHDPAAGSFGGMRWTAREATWDDFAAKHVWMTTSPDSGFVRTATAQRRDATGVDVLRGLVLTRVGSDARTSAPMTDRAEWFGVLADRFGLRFESMSPDRRDRLWQRTLDRHRAREAIDGA